MTPAPDAPILIAQSSGPSTPNALEALRYEAEDVPGTGEWSPMTSASAADASPADPEIFLQFGAFSTSQTAVNLAGRLNQQIGRVESRQAHVEEGDGLHRVRIGPYPTRTAAVNAALRIQQETGMQPSVALR